MPAYFLSIVDALNGESEIDPVKPRTERFTAPDAAVLIVDDIETNLRVGEGLLRPYKMEVTTCTNGRESIKALQKKDYDLVLMDHMMPEMDGVEAVSIIRRIGGEYAELPIIALTANAIVGAKEMFLQNGFDDFLSKPIEPSKLNDILVKWIPKEKQQLQNTVEDTCESLPTITIAGVNVKRGIMFSGGELKDYLVTLATFRKDGKVKMVELANCAAIGDISLYTTYVHALKSASANIGAGELSEEAGKLEAAGIGHDVSYIRKNNEGFLIRLGGLLENIDEVISANTEKPAETDIDTGELKIKLSELRTALENLDVAAIDELSEVLQDFTQLPDIGEAISEILDNAFMGNTYKQAIEQIDELLQEKLS